MAQVWRKQHGHNVFACNQTSSAYCAETESCHLLASTKERQPGMYCASEHWIWKEWSLNHELLVASTRASLHFSLQCTKTVSPLVDDLKSKSSDIFFFDIVPMALPAVDTPRLSTPRLGTPRLGTPRLGTPRLSTPRLSTPRSINLGLLDVWNRRSLAICFPTFLDQLSTALVFPKKGKNMIIRVIKILKSKHGWVDYEPILTPRSVHRRLTVAPPLCMIQNTEADLERPATGKVDGNPELARINLKKHKNRGNWTNIINHRYQWYYQWED